MDFAVRSAPSRQTQALSIEARLRIERVIAAARVLFTIVTVAALFHDAGSNRADAAVLYGVIAGYAGFSALIAILFHIAPRYLLTGGNAIHLVDVLFAAAVTFLTTGSSRPFFMFFVFVLFVASVRSRMTGVLVAAAAILVLFLSGPLTIVFATVAERAMVSPPSMIETGYGAALILVLAFTAIQTRAMLADTEAVSRILNAACTAPTFTEALRPIVDECLMHAGSSQAIVAAENLSGRHLYLWTARRATGASATTLALQDLDFEDRSIYFASPSRPLMVWYAQRTKARTVIARGITETFETPMTMDGAFMSGVLDRHRASSALTAEVNPGPEWHVRLFLLDAVQPAIDDLSVFRHLVHVGAPALHSAYLVRQVRSRVAATERARLSRELHDGVLQSLIALELEVEALRRVAGEGQVWETRLHNLRDQLRHRIAEIRDLMLRLRVNEMTGADVLRIIAEAAGRLRREAGIDVRIVSNGSFLGCSPRQCGHLARIVQEALANIRKHSGARSATIAITTTPSGGRISIADDGRGFGFKGRMTLQQLEASELGPTVIKERTRAMGGGLVIESHAGEGARIDVEWTRVAHG